MPLSDYPGFAHLAPDLQAMLERLDDAPEGARRDVLERVSDVLDVFVGLDLLQFAYITTVEPPAGPAIDLIAPEAPADAVAWFSVDETGYDEYRDAVTLVGDLTDLLNPPIVLDVDEEEPHGL